jgi:tetratricopeptide (TPR) repeat protein
MPRWAARGLLLLLLGVLAGCHSNPPAASHASPRANRKYASSALDRDSRDAVQAHAHYATAVVHELNGEQNAALEDYYKAAILDPADEELVLGVSQRFVQAKQLDKAAEVLARSSQRPNASGSLFTRLGAVYCQLGQKDKAVAADRTAILKTPGSLAAYQNLAVLHLENKEPDQALKVLDEAARQPGKDPEFLIALSELYASVGTRAPSHKKVASDKALETLNRAQKQHPAEVPNQLRLADGFIQLGAPEKAAAIYLDLLGTGPEALELRLRVRLRLADIYLRQNQRDKAVEQFKAIQTEDPTNPQASYFLGSIAFEDKRPSEAVDHFEKAILLNPNFEQAYYDLALAQIDLNHTSDALATLDRSRRRFPQNFVQEFLSALAFGREKGYAEAVRHFTSAEVIAQATDPKRLSDSFYFQFAATCERNGDIPQAEKLFAKCLELAPDSAEALNYLGYMWAERGTNLLQARDMIEKAVKQEPKNAAYLDSLAWVLLKLNQPKEALAPMLKAIEYSTEPDATVEDHLGDIYAALQQMDRAREAWQKSLSIEPNEQVRKKLGQETAK